MARVLVLMLRDRGANFRGEKCFYEEDKVQQMIADKICVLLDDNGNPIVPEEITIESNSVLGGASGNEEKPSGKKKSKPKTNSDSQPNPFEIDGFDAKVVAALADAGIGNPDDLRAYVASGKTLAALPVIGTVTEKELLDLYGVEG